MINLSAVVDNVVDNLRLEFPNGMIAKKLFMCILFVFGFLLGKISLASFVAYVSDKFEALFSGGER